MDVDDLMALAIALHVSPVQLLLGENQEAVTPTGMPDGFIGDEIWAWVSGEVELDPGEMADWWRNQIAGARARIDAYIGLRDDPELSDRARRQLESNLREAQDLRAFGERRIDALLGEGASTGVDWDQIPIDPTVAIRFPDGEH